MRRHGLRKLVEASNSSWTESLGERAQLDLVYLKTPYFSHGDVVSLGGTSNAAGTPQKLALLESIFAGGVELGTLAESIAFDRGEPDQDAVRERLRRTFSDPHSAIGCASVAAARTYDIIVVDQGYGGVYVHTIELLKRLSSRWSCLLICPEDPLFEDSCGTDVITLRSLRKSIPDLSYFSFIHIVRGLVQIVSARVLLLTHRSQSLFLFDLLRTRRTIIYCDGYYDGEFARARTFTLAESAAQQSNTLREIYYILANGNPAFFGFAPTPHVNHHLLAAGYVSLRDADHNWCWGREQTDAFLTAFPDLSDRIHFMPPFTDDRLFRQDLVARERTVLFTTTMHNIELKGFPELLSAMHRIRDMQVQCIVRQPHCLPPIPPSLRNRLRITSLAKDQMVQLYHKVWLNCRVSREESSPVSILESMVCEVPQVTSTVVARQLPIIENGKTGFVVEPQDRPGMVRALRTLLADSGLRDQMGRECRSRALQYGLERRISTFEGLLQ